MVRGGKRRSKVSWHVTVLQQTWEVRRTRDCVGARALRGKLRRHAPGLRAEDAHAVLRLAGMPGRAEVGRRPAAADAAVKVARTKLRHSHPVQLVLPKRDMALPHARRRLLRAGRACNSAKGVCDSIQGDIKDLRSLTSAVLSGEMTGAFLCRMRKIGWTPTCRSLAS